jgi:nucleotide-binding universal stress UspA family protein
MVALVSAFMPLLAHAGVHPAPPHTICLALELHSISSGMKILLASGVSHYDEDDAAHSAFSFPWPGASEIHVLSVAEVIYPVMVGMVPDAVDTTDVELPTVEESRAAADSIAARFRGMGYSAEGFAAKGDPETAILEHAKQWGADLVVVGWHDRSRLEKFLVGSVSESIVKHAPCSVLVLKHAA